MGDSRLSRRLRDLRPYIQQSLSSLIAAHSAGTGMWADIRSEESMAYDASKIVTMPDGRFYTREQVATALTKADAKTCDIFQPGDIVALRAEALDRYAPKFHNGQFMVLGETLNKQVTTCLKTPYSVPLGYLRVTDGSRTLVFRLDEVMLSRRQASALVAE